MITGAGRFIVLKQEESPQIKTRFFRPSADLAPYISSFYATDLTIAADETVIDWLQPEWSNIRFSQNACWSSSSIDTPFQALPLQIGTGPTSRAIAIRIEGPTRIWGFGILPQGWLRLMDAPANGLADTTMECTSASPFSDFAGLREQTFGGEPDPIAQAGRINDFLRGLLIKRQPHELETRIRAIHMALFDDTIRSVAELAAKVEISSRSLERIALKAFGFPPKLLMQRHRFLRSLSQFLLNPRLAWIKTLDENYVDQAHFVRDFKKFMQMSPSAYAALDHPIVISASRIRTADAGAPVQGLQRPDQTA